MCPCFFWSLPLSPSVSACVKETWYTAQLQQKVTVCYSPFQTLVHSPAPPPNCLSQHFLVLKWTGFGSHSLLPDFSSSASFRGKIKCLILLHYRKKLKLSSFLSWPKPFENHKCFVLLLVSNSSNLSICCWSKERTLSKVFNEGKVHSSSVILFVDLQPTAL